MEEVIWVEVFSRRRHLIARYRCTGTEVRIGRGYANDVFIDDPRVASDHLRIFRSEGGGLIAENRGDGDSWTFPIDGDQPFRVGSTVLCVRDASHIVTTHPTPRFDWRNWSVEAILICAAIAIELLSLWLGETANTQLAGYLRPLAVGGLAGFAWAGAWAVLTQVFTGNTRFKTHLRIAAGGILGYELLAPFASVLAFSLSAPKLAPYGYAVTGLVLALMCVFHLGELVPWRLPVKLMATAGIAVMVAGFMAIFQFEGVVQIAQFPKVLPPELNLAPSITDTVFLSEAKKLRAKIDLDREKEPELPDFARGRNE